MYRHVKDISIKEDLIEEVARIYGYDEIPSSLPFSEKLQVRINRSST